MEGHLRIPVFAGCSGHFNSGTNRLICILNSGTKVLLIQNVSASWYVHVHQLSYFIAHEPGVAVLPSTYLMLYYTADIPPPPTTTATATIITTTTATY